jgi:hypothetical protein
MLVFWPFELLLAGFILVDWYLWWRRSGADPKEGDASVRRAGAEAVARHVGAKIGIYNPQGRRVGTVSHTTNWEFLFGAAR